MALFNKEQQELMQNENGVKMEIILLYFGYSRLWCFVKSCLLILKKERERETEGGSYSVATMRLF